MTYRGNNLYSREDKDGIRIRFVTPEGDVVDSDGSTTPPDGTRGYAPGAIHRDRVAGTTLMNDGDAEGCLFRPLREAHTLSTSQIYLGASEDASLVADSSSLPRALELNPLGQLGLKRSPEETCDIAGSLRVSGPLKLGLWGSSLSDGGVGQVLFTARQRLYDSGPSIVFSTAREGHSSSPRYTIGDDGHRWREDGGDPQMTLTTDGKLGIGTQSPSATLALESPDGNGTGIAHAWQTYSDTRLKCDMTPLDPSLTLDALMELEPLCYALKSDPERSHHLGLLAQDVQSVFPELVREGEDGYLSLDYSRLSVLLLCGLQELQGEVLSLRDELRRASE